MKITVTGYRSVGIDGSGNRMPIGSGHTGDQELSANGTTGAMAEGTQFVRVATDTAITINPHSGSLFMPAGTVEFFEARAGKTFTAASV